MGDITMSTAEKAHRDYPDAFVEVIGAWVWLTFPGKPSKETRESLKSAGFRWANRRKQWVHTCGVQARARMKNGHPREVYGSFVLNEQTDDDKRIARAVLRGAA